MTGLEPQAETSGVVGAQPQDDATLTIDDLASQSQVPSRTIRFYQSKGVLPRPVIKGRVAFYGAPHKERLELIASLQDRGLRIEAIRELVSRMDKGELDIGEWLGLEAQLSTPWADDRPVTVSEAELFELAGRKRVGFLADLLRAELVERRGTDVYFVPSPALLRIAARMEAAGIDLDIASRGGEVLKKHLERAAKDLTELIVKHADKSDAEVDFAAGLVELRPMVLEATRIVFGQAMERELRALSLSGKSAKVTKRRKR